MVPMQLPGRLRATSLGDVLGQLHRATATGILELAEPSGRTHGVHLHAGQVVAVDFDGPDVSLAEGLRATGMNEELLRRSLLRSISSRRLHGEVLVEDFAVDAARVTQVLHTQLVSRIQRLEALPDAQLRFRAAVRTRGASSAVRPLGPREFLHGRRRARDGQGPIRERYVPAVITVEPARRRALTTLGLPAEATDADAKTAYRRLARELHPDLHAGDSAPDSARRTERLRAVIEAYRSLENPS